MMIREFTMADFDRVWQLWQTRGIQLGPGESREAVEKTLSHNSDLFLVAGEGNGIVGVVVGAWDGRRGWIYNHAVDPRFRRMGIGKQLVAEVERRLKQRGAREIALLVDQDNLEAVDFYERCDFEEDESQLLMLKTIA